MGAGRGYITETFTDETGREIKSIHKSRIHPKAPHVNMAYGGIKKKEDIAADHKQMVYYSDKYAQKQKKDRLAMV